MRRFIGAFCLLALASTAAQAGPKATNIRPSRSVPEMEAMAIWMAPAVAKSSAGAPVALIEGASLYSESVTFQQLAGTIDTDLLVGGVLPVRVPAGTILSAWWVNGQRQACTSMAQDPSRPGKSAYQLCLSSNGGKHMDSATVRKLGQKWADAVTTPLSAPLNLKGLTGASSASGWAWPAANIFLYRQSGGVGVITEYGDSLLSPQLMLEQRLAVRKISAAALTLRCEQGERDNLSRPVSAQDTDFHKQEEADVSLVSGTASFVLCGGRFDLVRTGDAVSVTARAPFAPWWSFDAARGQFRVHDNAFAYGAQSR